MTVPAWACSQWGQYEHDWLDCPDCLAAYETYLEAESVTEPPPCRDEMLVTLLTPVLLRLTEPHSSEPLDELTHSSDNGPTPAVRVIALYGRWEDKIANLFEIHKVVYDGFRGVEVGDTSGRTTDDGCGVTPMVIELNPAAIAAAQFIG